MRLAPEETIHGAHILCLHRQRRVVPSSDARAALAVLRAHNLADDLLIEGYRGDCTNEQDQEAVLGHTHLVLTLLHHSVDVKYYIVVVIGSFGVVMGREGVFCIDGEGGRGGGGGGGDGEGRRLCRGSDHILLGGLRQKRLPLGRHGGIVVIVVGGGSSDVFGSGNVVCSGVGVVVDALFLEGDFLVEINGWRGEKEAMC
jgi:hypothetical protein